MRLAIRIVAIVLGVIAVLLIAAALFVRQFDAEDYAGFISELVKSATGRELVIEGPVRLEGFPSPRIIAEQLRFGNAPWGSAPAMVTAKRLELQLRPLQLLIGRYRVRRLVLEEPEILLETNADGHGNWDFGAPPDTTQTAPEQPAGDAAHIVFSRVLVRNAAVMFRDGASEKTVTIPIKKIGVREAFAKDRLRVAIEATYQDRPIKLAGDVGRWLTVMRNEPFELAFRLDALGAVADIMGAIDEPLDARGLHLDVKLKAKSTQEIDQVLGLDLPPAGPLSATARLSEAGGIVRLDDLTATAEVSGGSFRVSGVIGDLVALSGLNLDVDVSADSLASIAKLGGRELPSIGPVKVSGNLHRDGQREQLSEFQATVGNTDLSGSLAIDRTGPRVALSGELRSAHLDLNEFLPEPKAVTDRLFSAEPLPLERVVGIDVDIRLAAERASIRRFTFVDLNLDVDLEDGHLRAQPAGTFAQGSFQADLEIDSNSAPAAVSARVTGEQISMAEVSKELRQVQLVEGGTLDLRAEVASQGNSVQQIMANLNGDIRLSLVDARVQNAILEQVSRDVLTEFLRFLRPASEQGGTTELHCAVVHLPVRDGVATVERTIAMETPDVNMSASGVVDFRDESLDLGVLLMRPKAIDLAKGSLADLARIQGTLLQPQVETDVQRAAVAVITGGVALFAKSVLDELSKDAAPCRTALEYQPAEEEPVEKPGAQAADSESAGTAKPKPKPRE